MPTETRPAPVLTRLHYEYGRTNESTLLVFKHWPWIAKALDLGFDAKPGSSLVPLGKLSELRSHMEAVVTQPKRAFSQKFEKDLEETAILVRGAMSREVQMACLPEARLYEGLYRATVRFSWSQTHWLRIALADHHEEASRYPWDFITEVEAGRFLKTLDIQPCLGKAPTEEQHAQLLAYTEPILAWLPSIAVSKEVRKGRTFFILPKSWRYSVYEHSIL